jgi:hypothetical protein
MKNITKFQKLFGDSVRVKIIEFYLEAGEVSFPIEAVVEEKNTGKSQTYEIVRELVKDEFLTKEKKENKQFYKLNNKNKVVKALDKTFHKILFS